ncbi:hypothetical protein P692DRAFT_20839958, partial [Suillus brevipes Sb2]
MTPPRRPTGYEFDAITLETVGAPYEGHTKTIGGLALSFDHALLASTSYDDTIKLWAFQSRQLLASFDIPNLSRLVLSPNSHQLAYTVYTAGDCKICICDTPPDVLAQARSIARKKSNHNHLLLSHASRPPPPGYRRPPISATPMVQNAQSTRGPQQPTFSRLSKFLRFSRI